MTREGYLERGGILFLIRVIPSLLSFMGFTPNTYKISFNQGKVFDGDKIRYYAIIDIEFVTTTNIVRIQCDLYAEKRNLDFTRASLTVMFPREKNSHWYLAHDTLYRGVVISRKA